MSGHACAGEYLLSLVPSEIFGLSNYASWEVRVCVCSSVQNCHASPVRTFQVAEIVGICKANGWVQPKIYQV